MAGAWTERSRDTCLARAIVRKEPGARPHALRRRSPARQAKAGVRGGTAGVSAGRCDIFAGSINSRHLPRQANQGGLVCRAWALATGQPVNCAPGSRRKPSTMAGWAGRLLADCPEMRQCVILPAKPTCAIPGETWARCRPRLRLPNRCFRLQVRPMRRLPLLSDGIMTRTKMAKTYRRVGSIVLRKRKPFDTLRRYDWHDQPAAFRATTPADFERHDRRLA